jgi:2-keto-3-deoxy-galactonokinase
MPKGVLSLRKESSLMKMGMIGSREGLGIVPKVNFFASFWN